MQPRPVAVTIFGILNIAYGVMALAIAAIFSGTDDLSALSNINPFLASVVACLDQLHKNNGYILWTKIASPAEIAASLTLIVAGIGLLQCKNWGRLTSFAYAVYGIIFPLLNLVVLWHALGTMLAEDIRKNGVILIAILTAFGLLGLALTLAYPILLFYYLTRPKNRAALV